MGVKPVIDFGGVLLTADHKVLVNDKWIEARSASYRQAASSCKEPGRLQEPHAGSDCVRGQRPSERTQEVCRTEVFDIINSGPRNRFMIKSDSGAPFIVHNCVQHLAREIINDNKLEIKKLSGYLPVMEV